jgi:uncharacterized membrane protein
MTQLDQFARTRWEDHGDPQGQSGLDRPRQQGMRQREPEAQGQQPEVNVGSNERTVSVAAGSLLALLGLGRRSLPGLLIAGVGGALAYRGVTGHCPMYQALDIDTTDQSQALRGEGDTGANGFQIDQAFLINKSPEELYSFWRDFENLPRIMTHLESVRVIDDRRSHWVAKAVSLGGKRLEWDAEITRDDPNSLIAWQSAPGASVENRGQIRFERGLGERGTEVHVHMQYVPPGGAIGNFLAKVMGENPKRVVREDLRNFKRLMEIGEILTIIGQPHGTCTGQGKPYTESEWKPLFT